MSKRFVRIFGIVWAALMIALLSSAATLLLSGRSETQMNGQWVSSEEYETLQRYSRLEEVRQTLADNYFVELDDETLVLGAIHGMTACVGDPYTFYYTPEEMERANEDTEGLYHGIGVLIQMSEEGYIHVLRVYEGTPAEAAGIRPGDYIVAVDGTPISGEDGRAYYEAIEHIRGEKGTEVSLTLLRDGETLEVSCLRADVSISYAEYQLLDDGIGYISLSQFSGDAAAKFAEAIEYFRQNDARGMIIDVRDNPGGLLDQVVDIADDILPTGVIVYIKDRSGARMDYYSDEKMYDVWQGPKMEQYRQHERFEKCQKCELLRFCRGCPAVAFGYTHRFYAPDPQCWKQTD